MDAENGIFMAKVELEKVRVGDVIFRQVNHVKIERDYDYREFGNTGFVVSVDEKGKTVLTSLEKTLKKDKPIELARLIVEANNDVGFHQDYTFFTTQKEAFLAEIEFMQLMLNRGLQTSLSKEELDAFVWQKNAMQIIVDHLLV
jgi:hypothetical protein